MSKRIKKHIHLLSLICECNRRQRNALIQTLSKDQLLAICECVDNVLNGNVKLDSKVLRSVRGKRNQFREIRKRSVPTRLKKEALLQTGGALPALLIPAISIASALISALTR